MSHEFSSNSIDLLNQDLKRYIQKFEKNENDFNDLQDRLEREQHKLNETFSKAKKDFSLEITGINELDIYLNNKSLFERELTIESCKYTRINSESDNIFMELQGLLEKISSNFEDILNEPNIAQTQLKPNTVRINPHIVHSRQTSSPFVLRFMFEEKQNKCNGCKLTIPLQTAFLKHMEEYPAGSKILRAHFYHINKSCFVVRGFEDEYLSRIRVDSNDEVSDITMDTLQEIGFKAKNIRMNIDTAADSDSTDSIHSGASKEPTTTIFFYYRRKNSNQKKVITCLGCRSDISQDSYLTRGNRYDEPFHLNKKCLLHDGMLSGDFSQVKCHVFKLLRNHNELKQLLGCGIYFKNIIGNKPPNPAMKSRPVAPPVPNVPKKTSLRDVAYIFNSEPFTCEKLVHAERCRGCSDQVRKEMMALRHREQVPRENIAPAAVPLVSQYYHTTKNCLLDRGFTAMYLERAECQVVLSGSDNVQRVRDLLASCGFACDRMVFRTGDEGARANGVGDCEGAPRIGAMALGGAGTDKATNELFLFIVNCAIGGCKCEGCGFIVTVNEPCFLYGRWPNQDKKTILFHINKQCLSKHLSSQQLFSTTCINNNSLVNVNPLDIIKCGLVNIMTSLPTNFKPDNRRNPFQAPNPTFVLDTALDIAGQCYACKKPLNNDVNNMYVLRAISARHYLPVNMHLAEACVRKCGYMPHQLRHCDLTLAVQLTASALRCLDQCGFKNVPG